MASAPGFEFAGDYTAFQFVFVLLQASAFGGVFTGFAMARDFESGFGRRMMLAAPNRLGILGGYAVSAFARAVFIWVVLTAIALAVGMGVGGNAVDLFGLYALAGIVNFAALMWAAGIALRFQSIQAGPLMQTPVFLIIFLAPVYVPIDLLSGWVETVAQREPAHRDHRGRPGLHLGRRDRGDAGLRGGGRPGAPARGWGVTRPAARGGGGRVAFTHERRHRRRPSGASR